MSLDYRTHSISALIGSKDGTTQTAVALVDYYNFDGTTTKIVETGGYSKIELSGVYTAGSGETTNSIEFILEGSTDRTNWFRYLNESTSNGTSTLTQREFTITQELNSGTLAYDAQSANFTAGLKVTGGTGGATAYIESDTDAGATGTLVLSNVSDTAFQNDEAITDSGTGAATVNGILTSTTTFTVPIDISSKFARLSVKETGVASNAGTIFIEATLSGK